ncbi:MAG TPA: acyl-CoA dehydrogenase family protein [Solirubrobacter sp.]|nr:acyl-CoA dehydrogenase family protein [Solirubrobacter sp.]
MAVEFGGAGATAMEQAILFEEFARARAPQMANVLGLTMGGPTVIAHGTDEQKARFLAPILSAEEMWCQGFSEPDAGSDLAALKTRAVRSGDEYVVTGQKVWTTFAHRSKWCMLLARTNPDAPRHRGLTYFLMDMEQDGVDVRPLVQITGEAEFNELFIEEARIPAANVIGGVDNGWRVAITTLMHERAGLAFALQARVQVALAELADELRGTTDPLIRQRFAQVAIEAQALRLLAYRGLTRGGEPGPEGSLGKWLWADINQALTTLALDVRGADAQVVSDPWTFRFLRARANSIEGGTTEILKNIVAERVLGLPRG